MILRDGKVAIEKYSCLINNKISFHAQATIKGLLRLFTSHSVTEFKKKQQKLLGFAFSIIDHCW